jgi:hypothetical protein
MFLCTAVWQSCCLYMFVCLSQSSFSKQRSKKEILTLRHYKQRQNRVTLKGNNILSYKCYYAKRVVTPNIPLPMHLVRKLSYFIASNFQYTVCPRPGLIYIFPFNREKKFHRAILQRAVNCKGARERRWRAFQSSGLENQAPGMTGDVVSWRTV